MLRASVLNAIIVFSISIFICAFLVSTAVLSMSFGSPKRIDCRFSQSHVYGLTVKETGMGRFSALVYYQPIGEGSEDFFENVTLEMPAEKSFAIYGDQEGDKYFKLQVLEQRQFYRGELEYGRKVNNPSQNFAQGSCDVRF